MFATVERSTAAICSNASFDVTQIWSYTLRRRFRHELRGLTFLKIARGVVRFDEVPVASIATNMNLSADRIRNRILQRLNDVRARDRRVEVLGDCPPAESDLI
jgi:hypothetical protein